MKVTVCFGAIRIVVPCGNGDLLVKDLINEATRRYKKAAGKEPDSWVAVHHLQTQSGILDPDDCVGDVADDREQILASFDDSGPDPGVPQGGGDGASGSSSVGTGSPDIFRDPTNTDAPTNGQRSDISTPHIEVTSTTANGPMTGLGLQVRRSSDPNLLASLKAEGGNKRWSAAAPHCAGDSPERVLLDKSASYLPPQWEEEDDGQHNTTMAPAQQPFARSGRLSMQFLGDGTGYKWMEAAEKLQNQQHPNYQQQQKAQQQQQQQSPHSQYAPHGQMYTTKSLPRESTRKEPLGQAYESIREKDGEMLLIINEYGSPLGLTAIPDNEHGGGLLVQHVELGSRAERGRLRRGDRILEINGTKLIGLTESKVQEHLRRSLEASELRIRVLRASRSSGNNRSGSKSRRRDSKVAEMIEAEEKMASSVESKVATVSPTRKQHTAPVGTSLQVANTRKLGRKIEIVLKKGPNGLGFSVTTRDNPAGGHCPIYIKNILPRGAAIEDGRLKPGDRLLEVDGVPMTGKMQTDVVSILRATQPGATVRLVVSRQQELAELDEREVNYDEKERDLNTPPKPPAPVLPSSLQKQLEEKLPNVVKKSSSARSLFDQHHHQQPQQQHQHQLNGSQHFIDAGSESAASNDSIQAGIAWRSRETLTLHIPVHDTEKAGLGVSVKGKTSSNSSNGSNGSIKHDGDLGIFVKNVIHGGAASRDGRLRMNDQLLSVNGVSLLGQNNAEAMETLRRAMVNQPGKHPGMITLAVARKIARSASSGDILEQTNNSSNTSDNSGATVIYLSPEKKETRSGGGATTEMNRWSNPVLDRLTGGVCSSNSSQHSRRPSRDLLNGGGGVANSGSGIGVSGNAGMHGLRNESYYMATNETWSPALQQQKMLNGAHHINNNNTVLIEDDPEPMSPTLPHHPNDSVSTQASNNSQNMSSAQATGAAPSFDATYSSQLSLETNNSGVEHFSRDALGRRSISEKHHAALDARETGTYQRNKKLREERERERRIQLTKSAIYGGSMESLTARIANANAQIPGYKHTKTASGVETQNQLQAEARDQVGDLGPSLGLKKSSSLESLQTMVQEIQMSDEPRGPMALRAPRGRGREDSLRAAVVADPEVGKARKHWLLEEGTDQDGGFAHRNGPFQSSLNDGKHKSRAKKPSILRGIGHMFRFGKNRKDGVAAAATDVQSHTIAERPPACLPPNNQVPVAALAALDRNTKLLPPAYQPPPPLPPANKSSTGGSGQSGGVRGDGGGGGVGSGFTANAANGIHHNDIFNHRYQHYANYDELHQHQQQISRRHQHYHSQRSARSQDINLQHHHHHHAAMLSNAGGGGVGSGTGTVGIEKNSGGILRPTSTYYEYETVQHNVSPAAAAAQHQHHHHQQRSGSLKQNGHHSPITINHQQQQQQQQQHYNSSHHQQHQQQQQQQSPMQQKQPHWKLATINGFSPSSLNSSARSRGPFVTHVTIGTQPTYQTVQKQQPQFASAVVGNNGVQPHASKV